MSPGLVAGAVPSTDAGRGLEPSFATIELLEEERVRTLPIGARGPSFEGLLGTDGQRHGLGGLRDRQAVVLIFTANRCPTAKSYARRLRALQADCGPRGVQVVLINSNDPSLYPEESFRRMVDRATADGYTFPYLVDADQAVARAYGPRCTFHAFVLDRRRTLRYEGRFDDARLQERVSNRDLADALDDVLADRPVRTPRTEPFGCSLDFLPAPVAHRSTPSTAIGPLLWAATAVAWAASVGASISGTGGLLHHDALIHAAQGGGLPLPLAVALGAGAWLMMVAAMMLPASSRAFERFERAARGLRRPRIALAAFGAAFGFGWALVGFAALGGDAILHWLVDATPWLAARPWIVTALTLGSVAAYQLSPLKRRCLEGCRDRDPAAEGNRLGRARSDVGLGIAAGSRHLLDSVGTCGPLMLLIFAAGFANLAWMAAVTGVMVYEARGSRGDAAARYVAVALLLLALLTIAG